VRVKAVVAAIRKWCGEGAITVAADLVGEAAR
jgi:hypothetical protein